MVLPDDPDDAVVFGAPWDATSRWRYRLTRIIREDWEAFAPGDIEPRRVAFLMLNPSTADALKDDATIRVCRGYANRWGFDRLDVVNLYAFRATHPKDLFRQNIDVMIGEDNDKWIFDVAEHAEFVVCAWGTLGGWRATDLVRRLMGQRVDLRCLGVNKDGSPKHPLRQPKTLMPVEWRPR